MARSIPIGASADTSVVSRQLQGFRDLKVWDDTGVLETSTYESLTMDPGSETDAYLIHPITDA